MNILIVNDGVIPVFTYGGIERVVWDLGKELHKMGHNVTYLTDPNSSCDFAKIIVRDKKININRQIPDNIDVVHFNSGVPEAIEKPYVVTIHGNTNNIGEFDKNSIFVSKNHAQRFNSECYIHNGLDWSNYPPPAQNIIWENKKIRSFSRESRMARKEY